MKKKGILIALVLCLLIAALIAIPAFAKKTDITVPSYSAQFQWRAQGGPIGDWTYFQYGYYTLTDYKLAGKTLHTYISYSPLVTNLKGESTVYKYDKEADLWINHEGKVTYNYTPSYGDYTVTNFFRGYVKFDGEPGPTSFVHGVLYQWAYIFAPQSDAGVLAKLPNAVWDGKVNAWLIEFSIYVDDNAPQTCAKTDIPFPSPILEPFPANVYNPWGL